MGTIDIPKLEHETVNEPQPSESDEHTTSGTKVQDLQGYNLVRDRGKRVGKRPKMYGHAELISYAFSVVEEIEAYEPRNYGEAYKLRDTEKWLQEIQEKMQSFYNNQILILVGKPDKQKIIICKWVFKRKEGIP